MASLATSTPRPASAAALGTSSARAAPPAGSAAAPTAPAASQVRKKKITLQDLSEDALLREIQRRRTAQAAQTQAATANAQTAMPDAPMRAMHIHAPVQVANPNGEAPDALDAALAANGLMREPPPGEPELAEQIQVRGRVATDAGATQQLQQAPRSQTRDQPLQQEVQQAFDALEQFQQKSLAFITHLDTNPSPHALSQAEEEELRRQASQATVAEVHTMCRRLEGVSQRLERTMDDFTALIPPLVAGVRVIKPLSDATKLTLRM
jgi:hypothetical protein